MHTSRGRIRCPSATSWPSRTKLAIWHTSREAIWTSGYLGDTQRPLPGQRQGREQCEDGANERVG
jgi:hypothetical protein